MSPESNPVDLGEDYRIFLNQHGYGFQYSVIKFIGNLLAKHRFDWELEQPEFPVSVGGRSTRIDFILRKANPHVYLIAECKKVNPALSNWCFSSSAHAKNRLGLDKIVFQCAWVPAPDKTLLETISRGEATRMLTGIISSHSVRAYHVGLQVRSNQLGDKFGKNTDAIEQAAGQVCKGLNGFIEFFNGQRLKLVNLLEKKKLYFMPTIFTTARLWTTDVDLASASIENGEFERGSISVKEASWIWYQYHLSPELKHAVEADESEYVSPFDLAGVLEQEFMRSIAIVNVKGIEDFLRVGFPYR